MEFTRWYLVFGVLLIVAMFTRTYAQRLWLNSAMFYLGAGYLMGPALLGWIRIDPMEHSWIIERLTEIAVILSLFSAGLKLDLGLRDGRWRAPLRLATASMLITIAGITVLGGLLLDLPWEAAVLLGAILAPTDPVLAGDVQVTDPRDRNRVRIALTGEAGLNDGTAFPFVMLGLGLLGLHDLGRWGWKWWGLDLVWASLAGLAIGAALGHLLGRLIVHLRAQRKEATGFDEFFSLGLIASAYGLAVLLDAYGFLAVFAAGVALRGVERRAGSDTRALHPALQLEGLPEGEPISTRPETASAYMTSAVSSFNQQTEHIGEFVVVLFVGAMLNGVNVTLPVLGFIIALLVVLRPAAVWLGTMGTPLRGSQRALLGWFGIRGLGSVYYLSHAVQSGVPLEIGDELARIVLLAVAASVLVHGVSVAGLMRFFGERRARRRG